MKIKGRSVWRKWGERREKKNKKKIRDETERKKITKTNRDEDRREEEGGEGGKKEDKKIRAKVICEWYVRTEGQQNKKNIYTHRGKKKNTTEKEDEFGLKLRQKEEGRGEERDRKTGKRGKKSIWKC